MRRLDQLIIKSFIGPFVLTTAVSAFILLIQHMLKYFDDFVGKDLGFFVFAKLLFYFSLNMLQIALPLGVLVSSLMTFGNLGQYFELTAIKSAGISLVRALRPAFFFVILISIGAFFFNDKILPSANLKAYSLLYDIKHKKPTMDIQEGVFYKGIPDYTIKANEKLPDDITLRDVIIYDHTGDLGNRRVILADSSRMFLFMNDRYLKLELFNGNYYAENKVRGKDIDQFNRTKYSRMDMVFSLASFEFDPTDEELFRGNRQMMDIGELTQAIDSMENRIVEIEKSFVEGNVQYFTYFQEDKRLMLRKKIEEKQIEEMDNEEGAQEIEQKSEVESNVDYGSVENVQLTQVDSTADREREKQFRRNIRPSAPVELTVNKVRKDTLPQLVLDSLTLDYLDSIVNAKKGQSVVQQALSQARNLKNNLSGTVSRTDSVKGNLGRYSIEKYKKFSQAIACIVMFLIGAPLGAIIKKGGFGVPVIISIFFFIVYYVLSISGEEYAKAGVMDGKYSVWIANIVLLPIGLFFLRQARIDARIFDKDVYIIWWDKMKTKYWSRKKLG